MPLPSQSRNQKWSTSRAGRNIPNGASRKKMNADFAERRETILTRDHYRCHKCGEAGLLIDFSCDRCICRRCLHPAP